MDCVLSFFCFGSFLLYVIFSATRSQARSDNWNRAYIDIARKYGGHCNPGGWFSRPTTRFRYGEAHCFLSTIKTKASGGGEFTQLSISWPLTELRMEVFPRWRTARLWRVPGLEEILVGKPEFDNEFLVRANNPEFARSFLSEGVCWQISRLCGFMASNDIYLSINRGSMIVKKPGFIRSSQVLDDFVRYVLELFDQAMLTRTVGIEFVDDGGTRIIEEIRCQVCGEEIQSDLVTCVRCRTPHCKDCWEYNGMCATYGCGETRCVTPAVAGPDE